MCIGDWCTDCGESEARILAIVGTFRVVRADDLQPMRSSRDAWNGDLRSLVEQGLIETRTIDVNRQSMAVVVLTRSGKALLEAHRRPTEGRQQEFHAGLVKPREIGHDSQIYRLYQAEAAPDRGRGGRVDRVVLDYELKRDYQRFRNRPDRADEARPTRDLEAFAASTGLPIIDDHLELPDLRIEYETADGRLEHRDVELVTPHYSRGQLAGQGTGRLHPVPSGWRRPRPRRLGRTGGTPTDPHHLEWLR